jgi:tRNA pseudouridine38-40 synthase
VSFRTGTRLPVTALVPLLRRTLPDDLSAVRAEIGADDFDARRSARARHYAYRLLDHDDLLWRRYAWHPPGPVDGEALARATSVLAGEHDFSALRSTGSSPGAPNCRVMRAEWTRWDAGWRLDIVADHFLYHMVRNVVGTALAVARAADPAAAMRAVIASRERAAAGPTIPPQGLSLEEVTYTS